MSTGTSSDPSPARCDSSPDLPAPIDKLVFQRATSGRVQLPHWNNFSPSFLSISHDSNRSRTLFVLTSQGVWAAVRALRIQTTRILVATRRPVTTPDSLPLTPLSRLEDGTAMDHWCCILLLTESMNYQQIGEREWTFFNCSSYLGAKPWESKSWDFITKVPVPVGAFL